MDWRKAKQFARMSNDLEECLRSIHQCIAWPQPWQDGRKGWIGRPDDLFSAIYWARIHADDWYKFFCEAESVIVATDEAPASAIAEYKLMRFPAALKPIDKTFLSKAPPANDDALISETAHTAAAEAVYLIDRRLWGQRSPKKRCNPETAFRMVRDYLDAIDKSCRLIVWDEDDMRRLFVRLGRERIKLVGGVKALSKTKRSTAGRERRSRVRDRPGYLGLIVDPTTRIIKARNGKAVELTRADVCWHQFWTYFQAKGKIVTSKILQSNYPGEWGVGGGTARTARCALNRRLKKLGIEVRDKRLVAIKSR